MPLIWWGNITIFNKSHA